MALKDMSTRKEQRLDNFAGEVHQLKGKVESLLLGYMEVLQRLCQIPEEFGRRFWTSHVEALVRKVKTDYENYQFEAQKANLFGKITERAVDAILLAMKQQPIPSPKLLQSCISISSSGKIEPALFDASHKQKGVILVTIGRFEAIAQRLEDEIMRGEILPESEDEIPKIIYKLALKLPEGLPEKQG